ncbi:hypothetical protein M5689_019809 [Euphorbia peplus]|nr:hypothetical protein M5689_019809 [Euphorbia peplus]
MSLCMGLWEIWCQRNSSYWEDLVVFSPILVRLCFDFLLQFHKAAAIPIFTAVPHSLAGQSPSPLWSVPPPGRFKINIDAACPNSRDHIGFGGIMHNHGGQFCYAFSATKQGFYSSSMAEALGLERAL